jgi:hypothetical protein
MAIWNMLFLKEELRAYEYHRGFKACQELNGFSQEAEQAG